MRNNPEKYSTLVYHNNDNQSSLSSSTRSKDNSSNLLEANRQVVVLPPPPCDGYIIEGYKDIMLGEAEKLYNVLVDQLVCEVINDRVTKQSAEGPSVLPALPLEGDGNNQEHKEQN